MMFYGLKSGIFAIFFHFRVISGNKKIGSPPAPKGGGIKTTLLGGGAGYDFGL